MNAAAMAVERYRVINPALRPAMTLSVTVSEVMMIFEFEATRDSVRWDFKTWTKVMLLQAHSLQLFRAEAVRG
jgi:hypothetical protein